jgi:hypothetical protein
VEVVSKLIVVVVEKWRRRGDCKRIREVGTKWREADGMRQAAWALEFAYDLNKIPCSFVCKTHYL